MMMTPLYISPLLMTDFLDAHSVLMVSLTLNAFIFSCVALLLIAYFLFRLCRFIPICKASDNFRNLKIITHVFVLQLKNIICLGSSS